MKRPTFPLCALLAITSCQSTDSPDQTVPSSRVPATHPWSPQFVAPDLLETSRIRLEPLSESHLELDYAALMGSREHLQRTLGWGDWPSADFTLEENRGDLVGHWEEFERNEAYAYTVLAPDRSRCLGCVYLEPPLGKDPRGARLAFWVIEGELSNDLDRHLVESVLGWIEQHFPIDTVAVAPLAEDARGVQLLADAGLAEQESPRSRYRMFVWQRPR